MKTIPFTKMHGCGNDYIYVNTMLHDVPNPSMAAVRWSDRHKGVGADGLVLIGKSPVPEADFSAEQAAVSMAAYREAQFDKLAKVVRGSLDMERVYAILRGEI